MTNPIIPFCPAREAILSPKVGIRSSRTRIFAILLPSSPSVIKVLSTIPSCPFFGVFEPSVLISGLLEVELTHPINTVFSSNSVFSLTNPCLSNLL